MLPDEPTRVPATLPEEVSLALAPEPSARSRAKAIGRVFGTTVGVGTIITSALGLLGAVSGHEPIQISVGLAIFFSALGLSGGFLTRRMFRLRSIEGRRELALGPGSAELSFVIRQRMLTVASQYQGRVTAAELAAALGVEELAAAQALEAAARSGEARMLISPEGLAVFEFTGLVAHKGDAKEPWQL